MRLFQGFAEESSEQATLDASQSRVGYKRARDIAGPAHFGTLKAATPRILAMIQDAVMALLTAIITSGPIGFFDSDFSPGRSPKRRRVPPGRLLLAPKSEEKKGIQR